MTLGITFHFFFFLLLCNSIKSNPILYSLYIVGDLDACVYLLVPERISAKRLQSIFKMFDFFQIQILASKSLKCADEITIIDLVKELNEEMHMWHVKYTLII